MSEELRTVTVEIEQEETRRARLFRTVALANIVGVGAVLALFIVIGLLTPQFPLRYLVPAGVVFTLTILFSLWLGRQGHLSLATGVYLMSVTAALFVALYLLNGTSGPMVAGLLGITLLAGLVGGSKVARWTAVVNIVLYLVMAFLEALEVLQPQQISGMTLRLAESAMFVAVIAVIVFVEEMFMGLMQRALSTAQQRGRELAEANRQAQETAQAEREAREREERITRQVRQSVRKYIAFLEQVTAGDYSTMLTIDEVHRDEEASRELAVLGDYLNTTVESLVTAMSRMQVIQQRYLRDAWQGFGQTGAVHRGFRYRAHSWNPEAVPGADPSAGSGHGSGHGAVVEPDDEAWLTSMARAVQDKDLIVSEQELALPITLRGEVIGAVGIRRDGRPWAEEEIALAEVISDQLAQTIESLRLLDESQRREIRERLTSEVMARMRETLDMETVLKTAANEIRQALDLDRVVVSLVPHTDG